MVCPGTDVPSCWYSLSLYTAVITWFTSKDPVRSGQ